MMTVTAARALAGRTSCFVGIGLPSTAANLARRLHAPNLVLIYESGAIGAKPTRLPLSIGDGELAETADAVVSVPEIFNYWLQPARPRPGARGHGSRCAATGSGLRRAHPHRAASGWRRRGGPRRDRLAAGRRRPGRADRTTHRRGVGRAAPPRGRETAMTDLALP